jgi:DNA-binding transcriptional ArsR family regulator
MIRIRLSGLDLARMRFAYSPLTEVGESLYLLHSGNAASLHYGWRRSVAGRLGAVDTELLRAVVPTTGYIAKLFLGDTVRGAGTTIELQLDQVRAMERAQLREQLLRVWNGSPLPVAATSMLRDRHGAELLADELYRYWRVAIDPYWDRIRAVLDADVAYRTGRLARGGIEALMGDLHPDLRLEQGSAIYISRPHEAEHELGGAGLLLVPCAFAWPHVIVGAGGGSTPSITYGPRGVATLWSRPRARGDDSDEQPLAALLGRSRAAILTSVGLPRSTTELARELGQSPPAVSGHLAILRRSGLVTSWRAGRRVLYQATPLARGLIAASDRGAGARVRGLR